MMLVGTGCGDGLRVGAFDGNLPKLALSPAAGATFTTVVGRPSASVPFSLSNVGGAPTGLVDVGVGGADAADWSIASQTCALALAPGATCDISVLFAPQTAGAAKVGQLTASANPGGTVTVPLNGDAAGGPALEISPPSQDINDTTDGQLPFSVSNGGDGPSGVLFVTFTAGFALVTDGCSGTTLSPGKGCTLVVTAVPRTGCGMTGTVTVSDGKASASAALLWTCID